MNCPIDRRVLSLVLSLFLLSLPSIARGEGVKPTDALLPSDTLFYTAVDDYALMEKYAESMAFTKIMGEEKVQNFLAEPKAFLDENIDELKEMLAQEDEAMAEKVATLLDIDVKRFFLAVTHVELPANLDGDVPFPDIGLALGLTLKGNLNPAELLKGILETLAKSAEWELTYKEDSLHNVTYMEVPCPMEPELSLYYASLDDLFVITISKKTLKHMIYCHTNATGDCLANSEKLKKMVKECTLERPGSAEFYVDLAGVVSLVKGIVKLILEDEGMSEEIPKIEKVAEVLGLNAVGQSYTRSLSKDGVARQESFISCSGPRKGLLSVLPREALGEAALKYIPQNTESFYAFQIDLLVLYDMIWDVMKAVDEEVYNMAKEGLVGFSAMLGGGGDPLDLRRDLIAQFGTRCMFYKEAGVPVNMMMPSFNLLVEIRDYDKFVDTLKTLIEGAGNMDPEFASTVQLDSIDADGVEIHYMQSGDLPMVTPCFAPLGDYLAFGLQIEDVKAMIKSHQESKTYIMDNPDFAKLHGMLPEGATVVSMNYAQIQESFENGYNQMGMYLPMMTMALPPDLDLHFDFEQRPPADCISKYLFSSFQADMQISPELSKRVSYGPFGGEVLQCLFPLGAYAGFQMFDYQMRRLDGAAPGNDPIIKSEYSLDELEPIPDEVALGDSELLQKEVRTELAQLSSRCWVYHIEFGKYPNSLDDLLVPLKDWSKGILNADKLPVDVWGNPYYYKNLEAEGKSYRIWSGGPNGTDDGAEGDDIVLER